MRSERAGLDNWAESLHGNLGKRLGVGCTRVLKMIVVDDEGWGDGSEIIIVVSDKYE